MKGLRNIFAVSILALLAIGCEPVENEEYLYTRPWTVVEPGLMLFEQGIKSLTAASGILIQALNVNEYVNTTDEARRLELEDRYYYYRKVRQMEDDMLVVYGNEVADEAYHLRDGLMLNEEEARWDVYNNPLFCYEEPKDELARPCISRRGEDLFYVTLISTPIAYPKLRTGDFAHYLRTWNPDAAYKVLVTLGLMVETNNSAFRRGEADKLAFTITGSGQFYDYSRSAEDLGKYVVKVQIQEPLTIYFDDDALMGFDCVGEGVVKMDNGQVEVTATMGNNAIRLAQKAKGANVTTISYHDWAGNMLFP